MKYISAILVSLLLAAPALANNLGSTPPPTVKAAATNATVTGTETDGGPGDCSFVTITITADIEGINDLGGGNDQVRFSVWDDGTEMDFEIVSVPVGSTETVQVTLTFEGLVGVGAPGVGVYIYDGPDTGDSTVTLFSEDPFYPETVSGSCPGQGAVSVPVNSAWMLIALTGLLALFGFGVLRARG